MQWPKRQRWLSQGWQGGNRLGQRRWKTEIVDHHHHRHQSHLHFYPHPYPYPHYQGSAGIITPIAPSLCWFFIPFAEHSANKCPILRILHTIDDDRITSAHVRYSVWQMNTIDDNDSAVVSCDSWWWWTWWWRWWWKPEIGDSDDMADMDMDMAQNFGAMVIERVNAEPDGLIAAICSHLPWSSSLVIDHFHRSSNENE